MPMNWSGMDDIGNAFMDMQRRHRIEDQRLQTVQGALDVAKGLQIADPKTGKPKLFIPEEHLDAIQRLIDNRKSYQAGAYEASVGIGKGLLQRALAAQQAASGPVTKVQDGITYKLDPSGTWSVVNAPPRNVLGQTGNQQITQERLARGEQRAIGREQRLAGQAEQRGASAKQAGLDKELKSAGLDRSMLFNPNAFEPGYMINGKFNTPADVANNPDFQTTYTDENGQKHTVTNYPDTNAFRVGYSPALVDKKGKVLSKENPGKVVDSSQLKAFQDTAASLAGPQAVDALSWVRDPANREDPRLGPINQKLMGLVTQAGTGSVQASPEPSGGGQSSDTSGDEEEF